MDSREFLPIAERYRNSAIEAERRTSAGRSYYALFNAILATLSGKGVIFRSGPEVHHRLISYMAKAGFKSAASVGAVLKDLRNERNDADYGLNAPFDVSRSEFVYMKARRALLQFDAIQASELAEIVKNIQALP
jgi:uncharacterized protein (UPF0332 family)